MYSTIAREASCYWLVLEVVLSDQGNLHIII